MRKVIALASASILALAFAAPVAAFSGNANENAADGQAKAIANCGKAIFKSTNGSETGGKKNLATGVTNCDKFWTNIGAIGN